MTIDAPVSNTLYSLLGTLPENIQIQRLLCTDQNPSISNVSKDVYHAYKPLGISFCFTPVGALFVLDAIDVYNGKTRDGFLPFQKLEHLPCGLTSTMQAHEIVAMLGEPDRKGGGGQTRIPCWIEYKFNRDQMESGIVIQLHGFDWEDREMGWTSFVLY